MMLEISIQKSKPISFIIFERAVNDIQNERNRADLVGRSIFINKKKNHLLKLSVWEWLFGNRISYYIEPKESFPDIKSCIAHGVIMIPEGSWLLHIGIHIHLEIYP